MSVLIAVLVVNDTRPSYLRRGRRLLRGVPSDTGMRLLNAVRSSNIRADAIVFNAALSAYARNRPPLWKPARRATCNARSFRLPRSPTASSGHCVVIRRSLHASAEPPGRHGGSLAASDELWPALLIKVVKLYGLYAALDGCDLV